ncbi:MAG: response regulator [Verrucomicrobiae bacterium]|nr:response regulator [Verrucomicrobiae bacterium]
MALTTVQWPAVQRLSKIIFSGWGVLGVAAFCLAAVPPAPVPVEKEAPWRIANFSKDAGVGRRNVFDLAFETNGVAWFAVSDGLYRYDGYHWRKFTVADGLPSSFIRSVTVTREGVLWVGTDRGAGTFNGQYFSHLAPPEKLAGPNVRRIVQTRDGALWFCCDRWPDATQPGGLTRWFQGAYTHHGVSNGLPSDHVINLFEQSNGTLIVMTGKGPAMGQAGKWQYIAFTEPGYSFEDFSWGVIETPEGWLFAQAQNNAFYFDGQRWRACPREGTPKYLPLCLARDGSVIAAGDIGPEAVSFLRWDGQKFMRASAVLRGEALDVKHLKAAPDGAIWAVGRGTILRWEYGPGLWEWHPQYSQVLLEDQQGRLWFAGERGLVCQGERSSTTFLQAQPPLVQGAQQSLWFNAAGGVTRWVNNQTEGYHVHECGLELFFDGVADGTGRYTWFYGRGGGRRHVIARHGAEGWQLYDSEALRRREVISMAADPEHGVWVVLNDGENTRYEIVKVTTNGLAVPPVAGEYPRVYRPQLCVSHQVLYVFGYSGLWTSPLTVPLKFTYVEQAKGVVSFGRSVGEVSAFVVREGIDGRAAIVVHRGANWFRHPIHYGQRLWLGETGWLLVADGAEMVLWQVHEWDAPTYLSLPAEASINSLIRIRDHDFWLGTSMGVLRRHSRPIQPDTDLGGPAAVDEDTPAVFFARGLAPFTPLEQNRRYSFSWRLNDGTWSDYGDWPAAGLMFTNLPSGTHFLSVRARDGLGGEDPSPAVLSFVVKPLPLQKQPWFRWAVGSGVAMLAVLSAALALLSRRLHMYANHLKDLVKARTAELEEDVARRQKAEAAEREARQLLRSVLDTVPARVFWKDRHCRYLGCNLSFALDTRLPSPEAVVGKTDDELEWKEFAALYRADDMEVMDSGKPKLAFEEPIIMRGERRWLRTSKVPLRDVQGNIIGVLGTYEDITERKQAREELARRVEYMRVIAELASEFVATTADQTDPLVQRTLATIGQMTHADRAYVFLLRENAPVADNTHEWCAEGIEPQKPNLQGINIASMPWWVQQMRSGKMLYIPDVSRMPAEAAAEQKLLAAQGIQSLLVIPMMEMGEPMGFVGLDSVRQPRQWSSSEQDFLRLISATIMHALLRRRAEEKQLALQTQLMHAQKMESVGRLAGGVAHDFNNMLQAILGNVEMALLEEELPAGLREHLEEIRKSAERSARLTQQLLGYARKQTILPRRVDLNQEIAQLMQMLQRLIGEHIKLVWAPGVDLWPVWLDPGQLNQVLTNLVVNARDAIGDRPGGQITLETANVVLDEAYAAQHPGVTTGEYVRVVVSDNGSGMSAEVKAKLFEPFFTTKEVGKGTGLGLATVYGIMQQNRGHVSVTSQEGQGAAIMLYFPRHVSPQEQREREQEAEGLPGARGEERVMLVEDEDQVLQLGRRLLERRGYRVLAAHSPAEALEKAEACDGPIDLLITDVVMPGMNGRELRDRLRQKWPGLKCIFMSGYTADVLAPHGVLEEGVAFLAKPFSAQDFCRQVRCLLDQPA